MRLSEVNRITEMLNENTAEASKLNSIELKERMKFHEEAVIKRLIGISKLVDPYSMDFVRIHLWDDFEDGFTLGDILYHICTELKQYQVFKSKLLDTEQVYNLKLDVRHLIFEIGVEPYGRLFKFLEKSTIRFIDEPYLLVLDKLKYNSFNSNEGVRDEAIREYLDRQNELEELKTPEDFKNFENEVNAL